MFPWAGDVLHPDCVEAMVALFEAHPTLRLVLSLRDFETESPADSAAAGVAGEAPATS
jgi:hypothetical protein